MLAVVKKIDAAAIRADFNDPHVVVHYARAAHRLGLWASERRMIERWLPDRDATLLEVGCGAGRVTLGLWELGYRRLTAVDFAEELLDQARSLAALRCAGDLRFLLADATRLRRCHLLNDRPAAAAAPTTQPPPAAAPSNRCHLSDDKLPPAAAPGATETCHVLRDKCTGFAGHRDAKGMRAREGGRGTGPGGGVRLGPCPGAQVNARIAGQARAVGGVATGSMGSRRSTVRPRKVRVGSGAVTRTDGINAMKSPPATRPR